VGRHCSLGTNGRLQRNACEFAERKGVNHNFKQKIKLEVKNWAQGFLRQSRELNVRKPEPITVSMILAFSKIEVSRIYGNLVAVFKMCTF
jgi:hypothetical protein